MIDFLMSFNHGWFVLHYITLRCVLAALTAFFLSLAVGPKLIRFLVNKQIGQVVRQDGPASHLGKQGTPTMGGVLILFVILLSIIIWCDLHNVWVQIIALTLLLFSAIGGIDDWWKISKHSSSGMSAKMKIILQIMASLVLMLVLYFNITTSAQTHLILPLFKSMSVDLGYMLVPFGVLVIVSTSNAVNLTDGLDGLVIMPVILIAAGLGVFAYLSGNNSFADYLLIPYLPNMSEVSVFCAAIVGAGLGFLWFNAYPAQLFMGDIGSLSLGAALGMIAMLVRQELLLIIMGAVFVAEAASVILQVLSYKIRGKRIFKMAPLHHHYELKGVPESKLIVRFWIITLVLVLLSLASLKLR